MYFLRGSLPWQGLKVEPNEDRYKKIFEKKKSISAEELCQGYASEFCQLVNYTRNLSFEQEPDYNFLRGLLKTVIIDNKFDHKIIDFDWESKRRSFEKNVNKAISTTTNKILNKENNLNTTQLKTNTVTQNLVKSIDNTNYTIQLPNINQFMPNVNNGNSHENVAKKKDSETIEIFSKKNLV